MSSESGRAGKINLSGLIIYYLLFTKVIMFGLNVCPKSDKVNRMQMDRDKGVESGYLDIV